MRFVGGIVESTMLNRASTLEDVGNVAAFVASDKARSMTAATANVSCGALINQVDLRASVRYELVPNASGRPPRRFRRTTRE
jgi:enoyl-[acyl-carrier-protein] reductase (NADH)